VLVLDMIEILPPLGKYKYDTCRILPVKCYIDNFVCLWSCIQNVSNVGDIRSFLGLAGYYWRFIEGFSNITKPMTKLLRKDKKFKWMPACKASFQELKKRLTIASVLVMLDMEKSFSIYCDASGQGLECVLMQDGHVVTYAS
jgi:hypothetical protein